MDGISWVDSQNEDFFIANEYGGMFPTPLLTNVRARFRKSLLDDYCGSFIIPNHGLLDFDIVAFQTSYHRENDTFNTFNTCDIDRNNWFVYKVDLEQYIDRSTQISSLYYNGLIYSLHGFSIFSPICLSSIPGFTLPPCGIPMNLHLVGTPHTFSMLDIQLIQSYLYFTIMGLPQAILNPYFFIYPLFMRPISSDSLHSLLNPHQVLIGLLDNIQEINSPEFLTMSELVYNPNICPKVLRIDKIDLNRYEIINYSLSSQIIYSEFGELEYLTKSWLKYFDDKSDSKPQKLQCFYEEFVNKQHLATQILNLSKPKVDTIRLPIQGFKHTRLFPDLPMGLINILPLIHHIRYHLSLNFLQKYMDVYFDDPLLLERSLTHFSYNRETPRIGIPLVFLKYSLSKTGNLNDDTIFSTFHLCKNRKRTNFAKNQFFYCGDNNEKLEFLGDAVIEFLATVSLFHLFPDSSEGSLSIFRSAIVQNCHLSKLASDIFLGDFLLLDIPIQSSQNPSAIKKISADALESIFGALFLDKSLSECQKLLGRLLWSNNKLLNNIWVELPQYPVITWSSIFSKLEHPYLFEAFKKLEIFEQSIGLRFSSKNLLAKAFAQPSTPFNIYTCGSNSTLEFLGDSVLQFVVSKHLFLNIPQVEGILSNLRSSLVNNYNLSKIGEELDLRSYIIMQPNESINDFMLADVFESLIAVIYLDRGLHYVDKFCEILFFKPPTLYSETNPKLTLMVYSKKIQPSSFITYKILNIEGPSNNSRYTVGLYLGSRFLAIGIGITRKVAEANAAKEALEKFNLYMKNLSTETHPYSC